MTSKWYVHKSIIFLNAEIRVVDNQTDMSSCDLNRDVSLLRSERMEKMGKRIWRQTMDQKAGVKPLP